MDEIIEFIENAFQYVKNLIQRIINGILNFTREVVGWFKSLALKQGRDIPFIADKEKFKSALRNAPVKKVGIFKGVYNEATDEISHSEFVEADDLDAQTREVLGNDNLVVLA